MGVRLGLGTDASLAQKADTALVKPPAVRETSVRETIAFLQAGGQVGCPPAISTDASLGYLVMAHQRWEILLYSTAWDKFALFRLGGTTFREHGGAEAEVAQCAKVGYSTCCDDSTQAAVPATYEVGEDSNVKSRGLELWKPSGPEAARPYATFLYSREYGSSSKSRRWAAQSYILRFRRFFADDFALACAFTGVAATLLRPWTSRRHPPGLHFSLLFGINHLALA